MPNVQVYTHHTGRLLGTVPLTDAQLAQVQTPPALTPRLENGVTTYRPEDHVVQVGAMTLFRAKFNGVDRVVSNTHGAVVAAAK